MPNRSPWPAPLAAVAAVLAAALLAAPVAAQAFDPAAQVTAQDDAVDVGPSGNRTIAWTVANAAAAFPLGQAGAATATVTLRIPAGWTASLAPGDASFQLAPGQNRVVTVLASPARDAPPDGALVLTATMTDGAGRTSPPSSAATLLGFVPPAAPPTSKAWSPLLLYAGLALATLGVLAIAALAYLRRASQVALHVDPRQRPITAGTDGIFLVQVENLGRSRRDVDVEVGGLPSTWHAAFSFPTVQLAAGERGPVPLCIKVPPDAPDGQLVDVVLRARPSGRYPWLVRATTRIEAHDRVRIGHPPAPEQ